MKKSMTFLGVIAIPLALSLGAVVNAEEPSERLNRDQLDDMVAPVALYPDALLGQLLVASTYPLELVEANQWLQAHSQERGRALEDDARNQNWDPSIQALVAFPDVMRQLASDIRWTTDLGNAFLSQQADVMDAVQEMRARARDRGRLVSNPQETVTTESEGGRAMISIEPADPEVVYVPSYNPAYVWGPPAFGYYPPLVYPAISFGFGFGPGIYVSDFFAGIGWGGWGWGLNWFHGDVFLNHGFFHRYAFRGFRDEGFFGRRAWAHNPEHRLGVAYPRAVAGRFAPYGRGVAASRGFSPRQPLLQRNSAPSRATLGERHIPSSTYASRGASPRFDSPAFRSTPSHVGSVDRGGTDHTFYARRSAPNGNSYREGSRGSAQSAPRAYATPRGNASSGSSHTSASSSHGSHTQAHGSKER